jgi:hypothetical protein
MITSTWKNLSRLSGLCGSIFLFINIPMFYRRKILLALFQSFAGRIEADRVQPLMFLASRLQARPDYHFVPAPSGCFSFQLNTDLIALANAGALHEQAGWWHKTDPADYAALLKPADRELPPAVAAGFGGKSRDELWRHIFTAFPFYGINAPLAETLLDRAGVERVAAARAVFDGTVLFTIGYEGRTLEEYLNILLEADVRLLADVRRNAFSMKFGFSRNQLHQGCRAVGIGYEHFPEVGVASELRQGLVGEYDRAVLFEYYRQESLPQTVDTQDLLLERLDEFKRMALTCYEAQPCDCHRFYLAEAMARRPGFHYGICHL